LKCCRDQRECSMLPIISQLSMKLSHTWSWVSVIGMCSLGMVCSGAEVDSNLDDYEWRCRINGSFETGLTYKVLLPEDVYDGSRSFPLDVKVVDEDGMPFPVIIWARTARSGIDPVRSTPRSPPQFNEELGFTFREYVIESGFSGEARPVHNRVTVNVGGTEYIRRVEVWGGEDINSLSMLGSGFLIEQKLPFPVRNRTIDYPETSAPLIVVRVFNDAQNAQAPLEWRATEFMKVTVDDQDHEMIDLKVMHLPESEEERDGVLFVYLDTGAENRQLLYLDIETSEQEFAVPVKVFGRNDESNSWRWVTDGGIHDIAGRKQARIVLPRTDYRFLKVEFYHYDQKAPRIEGITAGAVPYYLVFTALSDKKAHLYFGSSRYQLPMNEMSRSMSRRSISDAEEVTLSRRHVNPTRVASSLNQYGRTLLNLGIGVVVLLGAIVTVRIIRHRFL